MDADKQARAKLYIEQAADLLASAENPDGSFKTFDQIESHADNLGDHFSTLLKQVSIDRSVDSPTAAPTCPKCDQPGRLRDEPDPRVIQTSRGEIQWNEEEYFCRKCRKSFFPSDRSLGTASGVDRQSAG